MVARLTLQRALLGTIAAALLLGIVPAGVAMNRRLIDALIAGARSDLEMAPRVLADRASARADMLRMHAVDFARSPALAAALARRDAAAVRDLADRARPQLGGEPIVISFDGHLLVGPAAAGAWIDQTRRGDTPVNVAVAGDTIFNIALAPVRDGASWVGAAGVADPVNAQTADALARLTRSDITIMIGDADSIAVTTLDAARVSALRESIHADRTIVRAHEYGVGAHAVLAVAAPLSDSARVVFSRARDEALAVIPQLYRVALGSAAIALVVILVFGALMASRVARPVRELSMAAIAMEQGRFDAPLPQSRIEEVARVADQFGRMRTTLERQMTDLRHTNDALADRNARLVALQADLMQRDRLAATGRLLANLAHEIRNPVANVRNLLELIRRRVTGDPDASEYTELAIDELLRMHELAEGMLDLNRPKDPAAQRCDPASVARDVVRLTDAASDPRDVRVEVQGDSGIEATIGPDALKQVLINLVQNAREAVEQANGGAARIAIDIRPSPIGVSVAVEDNGPGVPAEIRPRIFDPFFTTKSAVDGVGLGLFVAEGLVRSAGGRLTLETPPAGGSRFVVELPAATVS